MRGAYFRPAEWAPMLRPHWRRAQAWGLRQRRALRAGDARSVSSVTLALMIFTVMLCYALSMPAAPVSHTGVNRLAEAGPRPTNVRMLDQTPRGEACDEQVWPYIATNCLKGGEQQPATTGAAPQQNSAAPSAPQVAAPTKAAPEQQAALAVPNTANERSGQTEYVPLPVPRPPLPDHASLDADDPDMPRAHDTPAWPPRRYGYGPDGRAYGPDGRPVDGRFYDERAPHEQNAMSPREIRRAQRHERRARHGIRIGDFYFRF